MSWPIVAPGDASRQPATCAAIRDRSSRRGTGAARERRDDTFLILGAVVVVFVWDRLPVALVAIGVALSLWATDVLTLEQSLAGFGDPSVLFIASLFVVSEALDASGVTGRLGQQLVGSTGGSRARALVLTMLACGGLTALITPNGSVAALLPVVVLMAVRAKRSPSELLIPLAFAAHAGGLLVLTASPVNVVVSEAADDAGVGAFGYFEFALVGIPLLVGSIVIVVLLGERLVPDRSPRGIKRDFSEHARTLSSTTASTSARKDCSRGAPVSPRS